MSNPSYTDTARVLASQTSPERQRTSSASPAPVRQTRSHSPGLFPTPSTTAQDRLSFRNQWTNPPPTSTRARWADKTSSLISRIREAQSRLTPTQQILFGIGGITAFVVLLLFLIFADKLLKAFIPVLQSWRDRRGGWILLWLLVVGVSFPPMIGYSTLILTCGVIYGVFVGWLLAATATVFGSTLAFLASRSLLRDFVTRLTSKDTRFEALSLTLKHDGLKLLVMIRLCPLPYSLSNGAIGTIPTVTWQQMAAATALATPKLFIGVFVGSRLGDIAEDKLDAKGKVASWIGLAIAMAFGVGTGWFMYTKVKARTEELRRLEGQRGAEEGRGRRGDEAQGLGADDFEYVDEPEGGEGEDAEVRRGDGISLHTTEGEQERGYRDDFTDADGDASSLDAVFRAGDGDSGDENEGYKDDHGDER